MKLYNLGDILESFDVAGWLNGENDEMFQSVKNKVNNSLGNFAIFDTEFLVPRISLPGNDAKCFRVLYDARYYKSVQIEDEFGDSFEEIFNYPEVNKLTNPSFLIDPNGDYDVKVYIPKDKEYYNSKSVKLKISILFGEPTGKIDLTNIFRTCPNLWNVNKVMLIGEGDEKGIYADKMFYDCRNLRHVRNFDMSRLFSMNSMFSYCHNLQNFDEPVIINSCHDMAFCFEECESLTSLEIYQAREVPINGFDMTGTFKKCNRLRILPLFWNHAKSVPERCTMTKTFEGCYDLPEETLNTWGHTKHGAFRNIRPNFRYPFEFGDFFRKPLS